MAKVVGIAVHNTDGFSHWKESYSKIQGETSEQSSYTSITVNLHVPGVAGNIISSPFTNASFIQRRNIIIQGGV